MGFLVFAIVLLILGFLLEKTINKLLRVEKKKVSETLCTLKRAELLKQLTMIKNATGE